MTTPPTVGTPVLVSGTAWLDRTGYSLSAVPGTVVAVEPYGICVRLHNPAAVGDAFAADLASVNDGEPNGPDALWLDGTDDDAVALTLALA